MFAYGFSCFPKVEGRFFFFLAYGRRGFVVASSHRSLAEFREVPSRFRNPGEGPALGGRRMLSATAVARPSLSQVLLVHQGRSFVQRLDGLLLLPLLLLIERGVWGNWDVGHRVGVGWEFVREWRSGKTRKVGGWGSVETFSNHLRASESLKGTRNRGVRECDCARSTVRRSKWHTGRCLRNQFWERDREMFEKSVLRKRLTTSKYFFWLLKPLSGYLTAPIRLAQPSISADDDQHVVECKGTNLVARIRRRSQHDR